MKTLSKIFEQWPPAHHALCFESTSLSVRDLGQAVDKEQVSYFFEKSYERFKIDDARIIKQLQSEKTEKSSVFILSFTSITHEAQNALLKVFEEPSSNTYFFLIYPEAKQLLVTLRSRLEIVKIDSPGMSHLRNSHPHLSLEKLRNLTLAERFDIIKKYTDTKSATEKINKEQVSSILNAIEQSCAQQETNGERSALMEIIYECRSHLQKNGASLKMILDLIAVSLY